MLLLEDDKIKEAYLGYSRESHEVSPVYLRLKERNTNPDSYLFSLFTILQLIYNIEAAQFFFVGMLPVSFEVTVC